MRTLTLASLVIVITAFIVPSASAQLPAPARGGAPAAAPQGPIRAEPQKIDFGFVKPDQTLEANIVLFNPLDRPIVVTQATPSCQCTGVDVQGKTIPARGTLDMHVAMKMSKAPVRKLASVTLVFGEIKQALKVEFEAEVTYAIRGVPNFIDAQHGKIDGSFKLEATDGTPFSILAVQGKPPAFVGFDPAKDAPRAAYELRYDFSPATPGAAPAVPKYLIVETDRADCPLVDLRVRHETTRIAPPCKPAEFRSNFGRLAPGTSGEFSLELEAMGSKRVTSVRSLAEGATVELIDQKADGENVLITCKVTPKPGRSGLFFFPVEIMIGSTKYDHIIFGAVR